MSDVYFDVVKRWAIDEWYEEFVVFFTQGNRKQPILMLDKQDMDNLLKLWTKKRDEK